MRSSELQTPKYRSLVYILKSDTEFGRKVLCCCIAHLSPLLLCAVVHAWQNILASPELCLVQKPSVQLFVAFCFLQFYCKSGLPWSCSKIVPFVSHALILWPMLKTETAGLGGCVLQAAKILWELAKQIQDYSRSAKTLLRSSIAIRSRTEHWSKPSLSSSLSFFFFFFNKKQEIIQSLPVERKALNPNPNA